MVQPRSAFVPAQSPATAQMLLSNGVYLGKRRRCQSQAGTCCLYKRHHQKICRIMGYVPAALSMGPFPSPLFMSIEQSSLGHARRRHARSHLLSVHDVRRLARAQTAFLIIGVVFLVVLVARKTKRQSKRQRRRASPISFVPAIQ